jgi:peptide deformylase
MALRIIRREGDAALRKCCRPYTGFNAHLHTLLDDLRETLLDSGGVGLAAPQVGVLRRCAVVLETNVPEGEEPYIIELVNPEIVSAEGEQDGPEGCLSVPGVYGQVRRPAQVRVRAFDRFGAPFEVEGADLTARAFCHELDHLDGRLFLDLAERLYSEEELAAMDRESEADGAAEGEEGAEDEGRE